jgi:hypothetical protein
MSDVLIKTLIAVPAMGLALTAYLTMMALTGRPDPGRDPARLRRVHKVSGWAFIALVAVLTAFGLDLVAKRGDGLPLRGVFHVVLAATLLAAIIQKLLVVRVYRGHLKQAQGWGVAIFTLTLVIFIITACFFFLRGGALQ